LPFTRPTIDEETIADVASVLRSGWITSGPKVQAFEAALSEYCGGRPGKGLLAPAPRRSKWRASGKSRRRDTVITTPLTWVATAT